MFVRRVVGSSMAPTLRAGQLIVLKRRPKNLKVGDIVFFNHKGLEKIKRIQSINGSNITVRGDNLAESTDSRHFGEISEEMVMGKLAIAF